MENYKAHILVVDDDDGIRELVKQFLNQNKFISLEVFSISKNKLIIGTIIAPNIAIKEVILLTFSVLS